MQPRPAAAAPPTPKLPACLRNTLIVARLRVPGMDNFQMRNAILIGIPFPSGLTREPGHAGKDLSVIIDQFSLLEPVERHGGRC